MVLSTGSRVTCFVCFSVWLPLSLAVLDAVESLGWFIIRLHKAGFASKLHTSTPFILPSISVYLSLPVEQVVNRYVLGTHCCVERRVAGAEKCLMG